MNLLLILAFIGVGLVVLYFVLTHVMVNVVAPAARYSALTSSFLAQLKRSGVDLHMIPKSLVEEVVTAAMCMAPGPDRTTAVLIVEGKAHEVAHALTSGDASPTTLALLARHGL